MSGRSKRDKKRRGKGFSLGEKIVGIVILIIIIWVVYTLSQPVPQPLGSAAPDFTLPMVDQNGLTGQTVTLSSFRGRVVLMEFMVPWCPHCQDMAPTLEALYQQYGPQNVVFLSVSASWNGATANDAAGFIRTYHTTWVYVYDSSGTTFNKYGVTGTPTFFILDKKGQIAYTYQGESVTSQTLAADIVRLNT